MNIKEYYQHYLRLHQNKTCRRLHVLGQLVTILYVLTALYFSFTKSLWWLCILPGSWFVVYPFAWSGHFFFEKNKPAAFKNPVYAKISDWIMLKDILTGKIPW